MNASPTMMGVASVLLAVAGAMAMLGGRETDRRLRERVISSRDLKVAKQNDQELLLEAAEEPSFVLRCAEMLGYRTDLPDAYAASLKVVTVVSVGAGVVGFYIAAPVMGGVLAVAAGAALAVFAARLQFHRKSKAYRSVLFLQIPDAMSLMLRAVRSGLPVTEAVRSVSRESMSPTREEFTRVAGEASLGLPIEIALQRLYHRTKIQEFAFFSVVIGLHGQTGGNLSETLENLADIVRRRTSMAAKAKALSAEGRLSAGVVGALPFVVGGLICLVNPGYLNEFITNPVGHILIAAFVGLLLAGLASTHWLIQRSTQD